MKLKLISVMLLILGFHLAALADAILYQTSFEPPTFASDHPLAGSEPWETSLAPEAISISNHFSRTGTQSLRVDGALLAPQASGFSLSSADVRVDELPSQDPALVVEITASVRLDGPPTGTLGTPSQDEFGASIVAYALNSQGTGDLLGALKVSSGGRIWNISRVAEDNYRYSVPYTLGTWRTLTLRVDFQAHRLTWLVDGVVMGSGLFPVSVASDRLFSGSLFVLGTTDLKSTSDYIYDPVNYTAYFDDYSLKSISLEGPALLVEQPAKTRLANGSTTSDFGNVLVGTRSSRVFTLRNAGNAPLQGVTLTLDGPQSAEFAITSPRVGTLEPGGSNAVTITFAPLAEGTRSATLRISSNDPDDNPFTLALSGKGRTPAEIVQQAYLKSSNSEAGDFFGRSVAVFGNTLVVGATGEDSNAIDGDGDPGDNSARDSGAAYVFVRDGLTWTQQAYLKPSEPQPNDWFGYSVAISGDTIVVGSISAAYVFVKSGVHWVQQASLPIAGGAVAISGDTLVAGPFVYVRANNSWTQQAFLTSSDSDGDDSFGIYSVSISGETIVVGAPEEDSKATGVNGNQNDDSSTDSGAAYVFVRQGTNWIQQAYLKASNTGDQDLFGAAVSISGETIVVGSFGEDSNATGVSGNQKSNSAHDAGAAYVFVREGTNWTQQAYLKASNTGADDWFGASVAISGDIVVVASPYEDSNATGVNGNQANNGSSASGAVYVFLRQGTNWTQQAYLKASNTEVASTSFIEGDYFGNNGKGVAISGDTIVVGAAYEDSDVTGVDGDPFNNRAAQSGAAYVFTGAGLSVPVAPHLLSATRDASGVIHLPTEVASDRSYTLQFSEDLILWIDLATQTATGERIDFVDEPSARTMKRFYRVKQN